MLLPYAGLALVPVLVGLHMRGEANRGQVGRVLQHPAVQHVEHRISVGCVGIFIARRVRKRLLGREPLQIEGGVVVGARGDAVGRVAVRRIEMGLDALCEAVELPLAPLVEAVQPGEARDLGVLAVDAHAVVDREGRHRPAVVRLAVGIAGAGVVDREEAAERAGHLLQEVGAAARVEARVDGAVGGGGEVVREAVAVDIGDGGLGAAHMGIPIRAGVEDEPDAGDGGDDRIGDGEVKAAALRLLPAVGDVAGHAGEGHVRGRSPSRC